MSKKERDVWIRYGKNLVNDYLRESDNSSVPDSELRKLADGLMESLKEVFEKLGRTVE